MAARRGRCWTSRSSCPPRGAASSPRRTPRYDRYLRAQAQKWIAAAIDRIPAEVVAHAHIRCGRVVRRGPHRPRRRARRGAHRRRRRRRRVARSPPPRHHHDRAAALVRRPGRARAARCPQDRARDGPHPAHRRRRHAPRRDALMDDAAALAAASGRLGATPLAADGRPAPVRRHRRHPHRRVHRRPATCSPRRGPNCPRAWRPRSSVAEGDSIEDAVAHLDWQPGEVLLVGSSRLAQPRRLFLGSTAAKMLHEVPVPMIVVPRTRTQEGAGQ